MRCVSAPHWRYAICLPLYSDAAELRFQLHYVLQQDDDLSGDFGYCPARSVPITGRYIDYDVETKKRVNGQNAPTLAITGPSPENDDRTIHPISNIYVPVGVTRAEPASRPRLSVNELNSVL